MAERKKVFITGASSALLKEVVSLVNLSEYEIVGLTRTHFALVTGNIRWVVGDLLNPLSYREELLTAHIVIHAAALTHTSEAFEYFRINVDGTLAILNHIPSSNQPLFVLISSRVAGENSGAYGESKLLAEELVQQMSKKWLIIRPAEVYGGAKNEGIDSVISSCLKGGIKPCPIGLKSKMYPIHQIDAAKAIHNSIFVEPCVMDTMYVNGPQGYSYLQLLKFIEGISSNRIIPFVAPKFVLKLAAFFGASLGLKIGFVPDQIARLYSEKNHGPAPEISVTLEAYITEIIKRNDTIT
ncbi:MAG: sugar nucleotide-binding protein [Flavobacteriales bacterium]|nr:sugar nucleotide-binding protein [Flavobacteriales bacterium]